MRFGFVIDNRRCIGCHACSTACKSENEVPLGVNRTWVKYTEVGRFPDVRRHFQVTRCNHCENPPCVRICPVTAMYQRDDGIVEFDPDVCIGCKACIQACPYDAIYIDPDSGTAAKCHYCAHRTDIGLEPACVVVCPEHAIIAGDMDDPQSEIAKILAKETVTVRKPEQGTAPKLFYVDGNSASMHPTAGTSTPETFMFTDPLPDAATAHRPPDMAAASAPTPPTKHSASGTPLRAAQPQGLPAAGPIQMGGRLAEQMIQVGFNAQHKAHWHWQVPAYVVTKDVATGIFMLLALMAGFGASLDGGLLAALTATLVFTLVTTALLVFDLEKPERFLSILLRPQWRSWLARGAFLLVGFSVVASVLWAAEAATSLGLTGTWTESLRLPLLIVGFPLALLASIYTAFLFGQAEGRDLWQSPLLPLQFGVRSFLAGAAALLLLAPLAGLPEAYVATARPWLTAMLLADVALTLFGELAMPHATETAAQAAKQMLSGPFRLHVWGGFFALGRVVPLVLVFALGGTVGYGLAAALALFGLFAMEYAFVMAPQTVPNS